MSDEKVGEVIAGVVLAQLLLVRQLEDQGALKKGSYLAALQKHMSEVSPKSRSKPIYGAIHVLIQKLSQNAPTSQEKH